MSKRILVPVDFTAASDIAVERATEIARRSARELSFMHVTMSGEQENDVRDKLAGYGELAQGNEDVQSDIVSVSGNVLKEIDQATTDESYDLMVMATHGIRGIRQMMFGADALKVARESEVPVVIVQERNKGADYSKIILPFAGHDHFDRLLKATTQMAKAFNSKVHIYSVDRPGDKPTEQMEANMNMAKEKLAAVGVEFEEVHENPTMMSVGFARQTLDYAGRVGAGLVAVMASKTVEFSHIAQSDKETMINNDQGVDVLLAGDRCRD